jgi:CheY-like chemotaxis protein
MCPVPLPLQTWPQQPPLTLLVDRDADTRRMYAEYLQLSNYRIEEAEDGREALAKAFSQHPDIVITETRLPGISGFELCTLLRNDTLTRDIPILVVTGDGLDADLRRARMAGADIVLVKPCLPETLFGEMRRLLEQAADLTGRAALLREHSAERVAHSQQLIQRSQAQQRGIMLSRSHDRHETVKPPLPPPPLVCPQCDQPLYYRRSQIGGVSARNSEQWDYFECSAGCGEFQYRQRTRKLRKTS